ncbi:MAG TPA: hypothetical protein EYN66_02655, partial [Myxococcales bacterium]|nr:hypothetical protein [Myxococcales bacterium]
MPQFTAKQRAEYRRTGRPTKLRGSGAYGAVIPGSKHPSQNTFRTGKWANRGAIVGGAIGGYYGGPIGAKVGSYAGRAAFHYPAKLMGSGSYQDAGTQGLGGNMAPQVPTFKSSGDFVTISHREYIGDLLSSAVAGEFRSDTFALNPGDPATFPWLSNLCQTSYQQYKFDSLVFSVKSTSGDSLNSTNTALGSVFGAISYDFNDEDMTTKTEIANSDWSRVAKPSEDFMIPVEVKSKQTGLNGGMLYVANQPNLPSNVDPKTYMLGKLTIGSQGLQGTEVNFGELWVSYKVRMYKPTMSKPLSQALVFTQTRSAVTGNAPLGLDIVLNDHNSDSVGVQIANAGQVLQFSPKRMMNGSTFLLHIRWLGAQTALGGLSFVPFSDDYDSATIHSPASAVVSDSACSVMCKFKLNYDGQDVQSIQITQGTTFPTGAMCNITMMQVCGTALPVIGNPGH